MFWRMATPDNDLPVIITNGDGLAVYQTSKRFRDRGDRAAEITEFLFVLFDLFVGIACRSVKP